MIIKINNKDIKFKYDINGLIELEDRFDIKITELDKAIANGAFKTFRSLFWAGLLAHDPLIEIKEAGSLMSMLMEEGTDMAGITKMVMQGLADGGFLAKEAMEKMKKEMEEEEQKLMAEL